MVIIMSDLISVFEFLRVSFFLPLVDLINSNWALSLFVLLGVLGAIPFAFGKDE